MGKFIQATAFAAIAAASTAVWSQQATTTPDLYDSTGRPVGQYKGDSVVLSYNNQPVRVYTDAHWDYSQGSPISSGLTWRHIPVYYGSPDCTGQAYIGTSPKAPMAQGGQTQQTTGPDYSPPAYGSQYLVATARQGNQWTAHVSAQNPSYAQTPIQSERQYDGTCAQKSYANVWTTPVQTTVPLDNYGTPPFYVR